MAELNGTGSVGGNAQNIPEAHVPRTRSTFPLKAHRYNTERYGEYTPIIAFESVKEDKLPVRLSHQLMSYTMKKPLMSELQKIKDLFSVPMEAILPINWEKFYDNPVRGDDVSDDVGPAVSTFWYSVGSMVSTLFTNLKTLLNTASTTDAVALQATLRFLIIAEYFYSNGSLMATLGCHGSRFGRFDDGNSLKLTIDGVFDRVCMLLNILSQSKLESFTLTQLNVGDYSVHLDVDQYFDTVSNDGWVPFRHALCLMRDDPTCYVKNVTLASGASAGDLKSYLYGIIGPLLFESSGSGVPFNTQFLSAYQLCVSHYFTNDHVDFVYSAELYRQLMYHYYYNSGVSGGVTFTRNGINYYYDALSAHNILQVISSITTNTVLTVQAGTANADRYARNRLGFLSGLFAFRRSLKYLDYFSGSRTQPLAVIGTGASNTNVAVSNSQVSVIDITRSIQAQRFLNSVNRIGHQFEKYLKGLFGGKMPAPDYHNPFHLANIQDVVYGDETQNTGDAQINPNGNSENLPITTTLRSNSSKYMFEIDSDRPCVIIAITHYDVPRVHQYSMDRAFLHVNRFDYFNPFLQYTGDQPVYLQELGTQSFLPTTLQNFGYTLKHMEYKQLFSTCAGGFVSALPGFIFPASDKRGSMSTLNDEWIRCVQCEFDHFYTSLTGFSLATYFHFVVDNFVDISGSRPMAFAPQILG